jgi:hypothetical protein
MNKRKNNDESVSFPHRNWREKAKNNGEDSALVSASEAMRDAGSDRGRWIKADLGLAAQLC